MSDFALALRRLRRRPGFTAFVVLTLALGIGAATTIFSLVQAIFLRPLPYPDPESLVALLATTREGERQSLSYPDFQDFQKSVSGLSRLEAFDDTRDLPLAGGGRLAENVPVALVTEGFFELLGVQSRVGRTLQAEDSWAPHAVLSHGIWTRSFGARPEVVGEALTLGGHTFTIVGVLRQDFQEFSPGTRTEIFLPVTAAARVFASGYLEFREHRWLTAVGRLAPGRNLEGVGSEVSRTAATLAQSFPSSNAEVGARLYPLADYAFGFRDIDRLTWVLTAAVALILVIGCANVANLLLVQAAERRRELAVRQALGATGGRVLRQLTTESVLIAALGGGLGALLSVWGTRLLTAHSPLPLPPYVEVGIDGRVLAASLLLSLLVGIVVGLAPALRGLRLASLDSSLRAGTRSIASGHDRARRALIVGEVTIAVMLLVTAGLLLRSFAVYSGTGYGFKTKNVLTAYLRLPADRYPGNDEVRVFHERLLDGMAKVPGVLSTHLWGPGRAGQSDWYRDVLPEGADPERADERCRFFEHRVSPGTLEALGIPLVRGRLPGRDDRPGGPATAVVSVSLADACWPGKSALGQRFRRDTRPGSPTFEVVGIVGDVRHRGRDPEESVPHDAYYNLQQLPTTVLTLMLVTGPRPESLLEPVRQQLAHIDPDLPLFDIASLDQRRYEEANESRFFAVLMGAYSTVALLLAAMGIYSVLAYSVEQRRRELAVREALGAQPRDLFRLIGGQVGRLLAIGIGSGLLAALALSRFLEGLLFQVAGTDPWTYAAAAVLFGGVGMAACFVPVRRAIGRNLAFSLKEE